MYGEVQGWICINPPLSHMGLEEELFTNTAMSLRLQNIQIIQIGINYHVFVQIFDSCIRVCGSGIKEVDDILGGVLCTFLVL